MAPILSDLLGQYPLLTTLARYLSTVDLFNVGLTSRAHYDLILSSPTIFDTLKRECLCDGHGLRRRVEKYVSGARWFSLDNRGKIKHDEEIEMRLFARRCDEAGALPCLRCGINICEECRDYPRNYVPERRPHLTSCLSSVNVMCLCETCDDELEAKLAGKFLSAICDCDRYRRWICTKCVASERKETTDYYQNHTVSETGDWDRYNDEYEKTKVMQDHAFDRLFYCTCGSAVPQSTTPRCIWCKRRHLPEEEWWDEDDRMRNEGKKPWYIEEDDRYPFYCTEYEKENWNGYPKLKYAGPIYQNPSDA